MWKGCLKSVFFLLLLSLPLFAMQCAEYENRWGKISQCPENLTDMVNFAFLNVSSNFSSVQNIDAIFSFNSTKARPTKAEYWTNYSHTVPAFGNITRTVYCDGAKAGIVDSQTVWCLNSTEINETYYCPSPRFFPNNFTCQYNVSGVIGTKQESYFDWYDISDKFTIRAQGNTTNYSISNVQFQPFETKQMRIRVEVAPKGKGKYDLAMKLSSDTWEQALQTGHYVYLDPWYDTNWNYEIMLPISCPTPGCSDGIAMPISLNNASQVLKMKSGGADLRYVVNCSGVNTVRNLWVRNFTDGVNVSLFLNYTNDTTCSHHIYYNNSAASTISSPYGVFKLFDDFDDASFNVTSWAVFDNNPYELGNGWVESHYDAPTANKYIFTSAAGSTKVRGNWTMYEEIRLRTTTGKGAGLATTWGGGNPGNGYEWGGLGWPTTRTANALVNYTSFGTWPGNQSMITDLNTNVLYQFVKVNSTGGKFNISRLNITVESLSNESWWSLNQTINKTYDDQVFVTDCVGLAGSNISIFWIGFTDGVSTPYLTPGAGIMEQQQAGSPTFGVSQVRLCQGTTCSTLGAVLYKNASAIWNATGNCSGTSTSTPFYTGNFTFWLNGTAILENVSTPNWVENQTNYSTQLWNYGLNKSDTVKVSLVCYNATNSTNLTSTGANSTAYTVNNTRPIVTAPSITWDTAIPNANSILTCNNGTYSDVVDGDLMNYTWNGYYTWWRNGTLLAGYNNQTLNVSYLTAVQGGENFSCFWTVNDTGYQPLTGTNGSANITLGGGMPITNCLTINAAGRYTITQDILGVDPADWCIYITVSNVELDGNFHQIRARGKNDDDYIAIYFQEPGSARMSGFNITNLTLIGWNNPIIGYNIDNVSFINLNITDNQSSNPPPDIAACTTYYGCITMWTTNNSYFKNINCTQSNTCGKGLIINAPGWAAAPWTNANLTMKNIKINSTNQSGIWIENTTNVFIQDVNITDSNVSIIMFNRVNNFSILNINISSITNLIGTGTTNEKAVMLFNSSNGTVGNFFFQASQASMKIIYLKGNSLVRIENSTIITSGLGNATFNVSDNSVLNMTNITYTCGNCFDASHPRVGFYGANITLWQPLYIRILDYLGMPLFGATVNASSNRSIVGNTAFIVFQSNTTDPAGYTGVRNATEFIMNDTREWYLNNHVFNASFVGYDNNNSYEYNVSNGTKLVTMVLYLTGGVVPPGGAGGGGGGIGNLFTCPDATPLSACSSRNPGYLCSLSGLVYDSRCLENYTALCGDGICSLNETIASCPTDCKTMWFKFFGIQIPRPDILISQISEQITSTRELFGINYTLVLLFVLGFALGGTYEIEQNREQNGLILFAIMAILLFAGWKYILVGG